MSIQLTASSLRKAVIKQKSMKSTTNQVNISNAKCIS